MTHIVADLSRALKQAIITHALGLQGPMGRRRWSYRNHYCPDHVHPAIGHMIDEGLLQFVRTLPGGLDMYAVTQRGIDSCDLNGYVRREDKLKGELT